MFASFASLGLPGMSGFVGEFMVILGSWPVNEWYSVIAALAVLITVGYLLWMLRRVTFGPVNEKRLGMPDMTLSEAFSIAPLVLLTLVVGIFPQTLVGCSSAASRRSRGPSAGSEGRQRAEWRDWRNGLGSPASRGVRVDLARRAPAVASMLPSSASALPRTADQRVARVLPASVRGRRVRTRACRGPRAFPPADGRRLRRATPGGTGASRSAWPTRWSASTWRSTAGSQGSRSGTRTRAWGSRLTWWPAFERPTGFAAMTVDDVGRAGLDADSPEGHAGAVQAWAAAVWTWWSPAHDEVERLTDDVLGRWLRER